MDDDLINLSLNQGKQFKNYQKKIKTRVEKQIQGPKGKQKNKISSNIEGFATNTEPTTNLLEEKDDRDKIIAQSNQADNNLFNTLQTQHNNLQNQYNHLL